MPALKIAYQITKCPPFKSDGDFTSQCYMALVRELATNPKKMWELGDKGVIYHTCPKSGDTYRIELLFKSL